MNRRDENSIIEIKERTREIMRKKGIQGKVIAEKLNISAATVSKDINTNSEENRRTFFTADQLPALCGLLGCTVDYLLTGKESDSRKDMPAKDICELLLKWIDAKNIDVTSVTKEESAWKLDLADMGSLHEFHEEKVRTKYPCFYFPEYQQAPEGLDNETYYRDYESFYSSCGNEITKHQNINAFLRGVINLRSLLEKKQLDQELYNAAVAGLLLKIKD